MAHGARFKVHEKKATRRAECGIWRWEKRGKRKLEMGNGWRAGLRRNGEIRILWSTWPT